MHWFALTIPTNEGSTFIVCVFGGLVGVGTCLLSIPASQFVKSSKIILLFARNILIKLYIFIDANFF